jgi:hypothetical protein
MGWMCSWLAVRNAPREALLAAFDLVETEQREEPGSRRAEMYLGEIGDGWTVVFSEDFDWASPERVREISHLGPAVGLQFEDKVEMTASACAAQDGVELWRVFHVNDPDVYRLDVTGDPPAELEAIRARFLAEQDADTDEDCDHVHEVPLEIAKAACGFRADENERAFTVLRPPKSERRSSGGFLARLFGRA